MYPRHFSGITSLNIIHNLRKNVEDRLLIKLDPQITAYWRSGFYNTVAAEQIHLIIQFNVPAPIIFTNNYNDYRIR